MTFIYDGKEYKINSEILRKAQAKTEDKIGNIKAQLHHCYFSIYSMKDEETAKLLSFILGEIILNFENSLYSIYDELIEFNNIRGDKNDE